MRVRGLVVGVAVVLGVGGGLLIAGPLSPPGGAVAPTHKTLTEVEPRVAISAANTPGDADSLYKITQPGSYYLTGNIAGVVGKHGVEIAASGVTLDLNGFDLVGVPAMGAFDGVAATVANLTDIRVRNGTIRGWGGDGIDLSSAGGVGTFGNSVMDVSATGNAGTGIAVGSNGVVTRCTARQNGSHGFVLFSGCTISDSASRGNTGNGIDSTFNSVISGCAAVFNTGDGIHVSTACVVLNNVCSNNGVGDGAGIRAGGDNRIEGNNCTTADRGVQAELAGNLIIRNSCSGNTVNWSIVVGNAVAPIVNATTNAAAINGSTYAGGLGSTDPNANFTY